MQRALGMARWAGTLMAAAMFAVALLAAPGGVRAAERGGCALEADAAARARCEAEQRAVREARQRAREEARRRATERRERDERALDAAWDEAVQDARDTELGDLVSPRVVALIVGVAWFWLAFRHQRRRGRTRHRS